MITFIVIAAIGLFALHRAQVVASPTGAGPDVNAAPKVGSAQVGTGNPTDSAPPWAYINSLPMAAPGQTGVVLQNPAAAAAAAAAGGTPATPTGTTGTGTGTSGGTTGGTLGGRGGVSIL